MRFLKYLLITAILAVAPFNAAFAQLAVNNGGTGAFNAGGARYNLGLGGTFTPSTGVSTGGISGVPTTYAALVAGTTCNTANQGALQPITDSTVITYNATISVGGGSYVVLAFCNGTAWVAH